MKILYDVPTHRLFFPSWRVFSAQAFATAGWPVKTTAEIVLTMPQTPPNSGDMIPSTLSHPGAERFWLAVLLTGVGTGSGAALLTRLLDVVQHFMWPGSGSDLLSAAERAGTWRSIYWCCSARDSSRARDRSS